MVHEHCKESHHKTPTPKTHIKNMSLKMGEYNREPRGSVSTQKENLKNHKETVKQGKLQCNKCHKTFKTRHNLKVHEESVHEKLRKFSCEICPYKATQAGALKIHMSLRHSATWDFKHKCTLCNYESYSKQQLKKDPSQN